MKCNLLLSKRISPGVFFYVVEVFFYKVKEAKNLVIFLVRALPTERLILLIREVVGFNR